MLQVTAALKQSLHAAAIPTYVGQIIGYTFGPLGWRLDHTITKSIHRESLFYKVQTLLFQFW